MRLAWIGLALALAQTSAPPPPTGTSGTVGTSGTSDVVRIDAVITDARGRAVENLKQADFELREDGAVQPLTGVQLVRGPRLIGMYLDEYFVSPSNTTAVRAALHRFVDADLLPDDKAVILRPLDSLLTIKLTQDRAALHKAIDAFEGRRGDYQPRTEFERRYVVTDRARADEQRAQSTWSTLNALTLHLANLGVGRTSVLFVSEQADPVVRRRGMFEGLPTSTSVTRAANRSNVSIYVFDPRDAAQRAASPDEGPNLLRVLADDTAGAIINDPNVADAGLRKMLADASSYYLLSYRSARYRDGVFHSITVIVRRPGVSVNARNGYWAPTPDEIQRANMIAHGTDPPPPLKLQPARHVSTMIRPWFGIARGDNGRTRVTFVWEPAGAVPGDRKVKTPVRVVMKAMAPDGATVFEGTVGERASAAFDVPPGRATFMMTIEDAAGNAIDSDIRDVLIRDLKGAVALGTPEVFRARTARDVRELHDDSAPVPVSAREFSRTERLVIRVPAYATSAPVVTATLVSSAKQTMRQLVVDRTLNAAPVAQIDVPLAALPPGQYSVEISAKLAANGVQESVKFRVTD
jgi:Ca-activated chloride channel family protein